MRRSLDSVFLLALLTGLYPGLFLVSNNWFFIGAAQSVYLLLSLVLAALFWFSLVYFFLSNVRLTRGFVRNVLLLVSAYLLTGYFDFLVVDLQDRYEVDVRGVIFLGVGIMASLFLIRSWKKRPSFDFVRTFNIGLLIMTSLALSSLAISVLFNYPKASDSFSTDDKRAIDIYRQVQFKLKPNIYLIVPDSYPSNRVLKEFFDINNSKFSEEIQSLGFRIYDDYFSSYPHTAESVHAMLSMNHSYFRNSIGNDSIGLREVIAGRNDVVNILRNNGYKTVFVHHTDYLFPESCFVERCLPEISAYDKLRRNLQSFYFFGRLPVTRRKYYVDNEMKKQISQTKEGSHTFVYGHFLKTHSNIKTFEKHHQRRLPGFRKGYPASIRAANKMMLEQIRQISSQDPSAIIIIVADHGTWAGTNRTDTGLTRNEILDKFNVFSAIKWGTGYNGQYDDQIRSGVNLFRYVFAYLSESETILETKANDESYARRDGIWKVAEDGRVLDAPEYYSPEPGFGINPGRFRLFGRLP